MPNRLTKDPERTATFFVQHKALLISCSGLPGPDKTPEGRALVAAARADLGYAPSTNSFDIMRALLRRFRSLVHPSTGGG